MRTKKSTTAKKWSSNHEWYKTLVENYHLPMNELTKILPSVNTSTLRRYKNYLWNFANNNFYLTRTMPSELKEIYIDLKTNKKGKVADKIKKIWNVRFSFTNKEGVSSTSKEYKSKKSVLSAVVKALKNRSFKDFQITYKEN